MGGTGVGVGVGVAVGVAVGVGVDVGVDVAVGVAVAVGVGDAVAVGVGVGVDVGVGVWVAVGIGEGVGSGSAGCVGGTKGVTVGLGTNVATSGAASDCGIRLRSGVAVGTAGVLGLVHAANTDAVVARAINATAKATVIGFLFEAVLGCLSCGFMTRKCYTTRVHGDGGWHYAMAAVVAPMRAGDVVGSGLGSSLDRGDFESLLDAQYLRLIRGKVGTGMRGFRLDRSRGCQRGPFTLSMASRMSSVVPEYTASGTSIRTPYWPWDARTSYRSQELSRIVLKCQSIS